MQIAQSTYYARNKTGPVSPAALAEPYDAHAVYRKFLRQRGVYGVRKMWHAMWRAGHSMGRDPVARLMRICGISGALRGKHRTVTTRRDDTAPRHPDHVKCQWNSSASPDQLWVSGFTYVWTLSGFVYVVFLIDVFSRRILGWRVMATKETPLVSSVCRAPQAHAAVQVRQYLAPIITDR